MQIPDEDKIPRAVKNEWFYLIARACMILSLPIGGFFMHRVIAKADQISDQVAAQNIDMKLLTQRVEMQLRYDGDKIQDHDARLRFLEKLK